MASFDHLTNKPKRRELKKQTYYMRVSKIVIHKRYFEDIPSGKAIIFGNVLDI